MVEPLQHQQQPTLPLPLPQAQTFGFNAGVNWGSPQLTKYAFQTEYHSRLDVAPPLPPTVNQAYCQQWEPPYFPIKTNTVLILGSEREIFFTPTPIQGQAYSQQWEPPFFPTKVRPELEIDSKTRIDFVLPAPISGQAWSQQWEPPFFPTRVKPEQLLDSGREILFLSPMVLAGTAWSQKWEPPRFVVDNKQMVDSGREIAFTTLVSTIAGQAYSQQWEPPFFPTAMKFWLHQTETSGKIPPPIVTPLGQAWSQQWEPPNFTLRVSHEILSSNPISYVTFPATISGIAFGQWEPQRFPAQMPSFLHGSSVPYSLPIPPPIGPLGFAFLKAWEPPFFPTTVDKNKQQSIAWTFAPGSLLATISGISWMKGWEPPSFKGVPPWFPDHAQEFRPLIVTPPILPPLVGKQWELPDLFNNPQGKMKVWLQQTTMWTSTGLYLPPKALGPRLPLYVGPQPSIPGSGEYPASYWLGPTDNAAGT